MISILSPPFFASFPLHPSLLHSLQTCVSMCVVCVWCARNITWSHILFEVLCIHVCGSCKAVYSPLSARYTALQKWPLLSLHACTHTPPLTSSSTCSYTQTSTCILHIRLSIQTHSPKPLPRSQSHYSRIKMTALPKLLDKHSGRSQKAQLELHVGDTASCTHSYCIA